MQLKLMHIPFLSLIEMTSILHEEGVNPFLSEAYWNRETEFKILSKQQTAAEMLALVY